MLPISEDQLSAVLRDLGRVRVAGDGGRSSAGRGAPRDSEEHVDLAGVDYVAIPARNLRRSVDFYSRVFGLEIVEDATGSPRPHLLMRGGRVDLALHPCVNGVPARHRWSFAVGNLDRARESLWNLGVRVADSAEDAPPAGAGRRLSIRDPDGHDIDLVERLGGAFL